VPKVATVRRRPPRIDIFTERKANPIVLLLQVVAIIIVAYFAAVFFIVCYAVFDGSGVVDPALPMKWLTAHVVVPIQNWAVQMGNVRR
jgi:Zn-dependent protease